ncbi:MAG TPA: SRPBCC family protein [Solirubrobacterales bacterium]|nr:SRPBCC family protein [Solirubrobacterales bacterium]
MAKLTESLLVKASLKEVWDFYFEPRYWVSWVDGFQEVEAVDGDYPQVGAELVWRSTPAGRGRVTETVLEHSPRTRHLIRFADPESEGELLSEFGIEGDATRVRLTFTYRLPGNRILAGITDRLFVRGQVRNALRRTLLRFKHEAEEAAHFGREPPASA